MRMPDEADAALPNIKIGFLNMMPDAALAATERQFLRLVSAYTNVNCYFYPFEITGVERSEQTRLHTDEYYLDFNALQNLQIDALVVTGANVSQPLLQNEPFWEELIKVLSWARSKVRSSLCSCLATHAAVKVFYDVDRKHMGDKCWGVFSHDIMLKKHLLLKNVNSPIMMCHSRFNDISQKDFEKHDVDVLIGSQQAGVQLACEKDMKVVYFQGHPEYDDISLLKEYKREIIRFISRQRSDYPPMPESYFDPSLEAAIEKYRQQVCSASDYKGLLELFPESELMRRLDNPWKHSAQTIFANWIEWLLSEPELSA